MFLVLIGLIVFFSLFSDNFFSSDNLINILRQMATIGIVAVGMTFVILTGGMDLSVGSILALSGVVTGYSMVTLELSIFISILLGMIAGIIVGLANGVVINFFSIPAFVTTLASMQIFLGVSLIITGGMPIFGFPKAFDFWGKGYIGPIPVPVIIMTLTMLAGWIVLNKTKYGRYLYAIGGNTEAARLSGIKIKKNLIITYVLSGFFASVASVIALSRLSSAQPKVGLEFGLDVITAVVLGGVSITGGEGKMSGVIFGVLIIGVLSNGLIMLQVQEYYQYVIKGLVLLLAVGMDNYTKNNSKKAKLKVV